MSPSISLVSIVSISFCRFFGGSLMVSISVIFLLGHPPIVLLIPSISSSISSSLELQPIYHYHLIFLLFHLLLPYFDVIIHFETIFDLMIVTVPVFEIFVDINQNICLLCAMIVQI